MLRKLLQQFIDKYGKPALKNQTGVSDNVIEAILAGNPKGIKFRATTLDILYDFFRLSKDNFYNDNLRKRYPKTDTMLGTFIRQKRTAMGMGVEELADKIKSTKLAILRLELGESLPSFASYTIQNVMFQLKMSPEERQLVKNFIQSVKDIEKLLKDQYKTNITKPL